MPLGCPGGLVEEDIGLDYEADLDSFLREVEGRAFRIAVVTIRDRDEALDIVQDAMISLVTRYAGRPKEEWRPLFFRILTNRMWDWHRRSTVRKRVISFFGGQETDTPDPIVSAPSPVSDDPLEQLVGEEMMVSLENALTQLPERQRQAFMLRTFEDLNVAQTARAMGCSDGSVKTHYSRAMARLRKLLGDHWL